ncbi:MAG: hypothetical protein FGM33_02760 [Candidatus Kapabacteria bacterium]|nr:hypothetical protein [Candidatus Kapabacteria bacterium]
MNPILRRVLAVVTGVVASSLVIMAVEFAGHAVLSGGSLIPDENHEVLLDAKSLSFEQLVSLLVAWSAGSFVGSYVGIRIAGGAEKMISLLIGAFVLAATVMNFFQFPHPTWLMVSAIVLIPVASWLAIPRQPKKAT